MQDSKTDNGVLRMCGVCDIYSFICSCAFESRDDVYSWREASGDGRSHRQGRRHAVDTAWQSAINCWHQASPTEGVFSATYCNVNVLCHSWFWSHCNHVCHLLLPQQSDNVQFHSCILCACLLGYPGNTFHSDLRDRSRLRSRVVLWLSSTERHHRHSLAWFPHVPVLHVEVVASMPPQVQCQPRPRWGFLPCPWVRTNGSWQDAAWLWLWPRLVRLFDTWLQSTTCPSF